VNAEQIGDFLYPIVAMGFDQAMVGATFSHDGYDWVFTWHSRAVSARCGQA
jgi:hypothetical protein